MSVQGIGVRRSRSGSAAKERPAPKWELSGAAREQILQYAREDAARGVYMGEGFLSLRRQEVAKAGPDRAALMARLGGTAAPGDPEIMEKIKEGDEMWLRLWFGGEVRLERQGSGGIGSAVHVFDENGDEILTYTAGVGWHQKESRAETEAHSVLKSVYYEAYHAARQAIGAARDGLDTKA